jgi:hypothetical protein
VGLKPSVEHRHLRNGCNPVILRARKIRRTAGDVSINNILEKTILETRKIDKGQSRRNLILQKNYYRLLLMKREG